MAKRVTLSASVLAADFARLGEEVRAAEKAGCDEIHFDVMDGRFVPSLSFGLPVLEAVRTCTNLPIDAHMMVEEPSRFVEGYAAAGASMMTVHVEACADLLGTLEKIRLAGMRPAVSLNPPTPLSDIGSALPLAARVLVMTVVPGLGGQAFMPEVVPKICELRSLVEESGLDVEIAVDGGVKADTARMVFEAGANVLVSGTGLFSYPDGIQAGVEAIREAVAA